MNEGELAGLGIRVGGRYRNRRASYEVLALEGRGILVRFDDGDVQRLDAATQARIMKNMAAEERTTIPPRVAEDAWAFTLGCIAASGRLEAEVPPQSIDGFIQSYLDVTGERIGPDTDGFYPITTGGYNKWGSELRVYLPAALARDQRFTLPARVSLVTSTSSRTVRINNNSLWWFLVERNHLRIGSDCDIDSVRRLLPKACRASFDVGGRLRG